MLVTFVGLLSSQIHENQKADTLDVTYGKLCCQNGYVRVCWIIAYKARVMCSTLFIKTSTADKEFYNQRVTTQQHW